MRVIKSADILDSGKVAGIAVGLASLNSNILVFGLPYSGKSTLVNAVCRADRRFSTLEHEEILGEKDQNAVLRNSRSLWCVGHQFPGSVQAIPDSGLERFASGMCLNAPSWVIVRIEK